MGAKHIDYIEYRQEPVVGTYQVLENDLRSFVFRDDNQDNTLLLPAIDSVPDGTDIEIQLQMLNPSSTNKYGVYPGSSDVINNEISPYLITIQHAGQRIVLRSDKTNKIWWYLINYYPGNVL